MAIKTILSLALAGSASAFAPSILAPRVRASSLKAGFDMEASIQQTRDMRLAHLEEQVWQRFRG